MNEQKFIKSRERYLGTNLNIYIRLISLTNVKSSRYPYSRRFNDTRRISVPSSVRFIDFERVRNIAEPSRRNRGGSLSRERRRNSGSAEVKKRSRTAAATLKAVFAANVPWRRTTIRHHSSLRCPPLNKFTFGREINARQWPRPLRIPFAGIFQKSRAPCIFLGSRYYTFCSVNSIVLLHVWFPLPIEISKSRERISNFFVRR